MLMRFFNADELICHNNVDKSMSNLIYSMAPSPEFFKMIASKSLNISHE
jgi:hypothetical protein